MAAPEINIETQTIIVGEQAESLWEAYDAIFIPFNESCPCRQSLWKDDFLRFCADPNVFKVLATDNSELVGVALVTFDLYKIPWINPPVLWKPREHGGKTWDLKDHVMYVVSIGVLLERRGLQAGTQLMLSLQQILRGHSGLAVGYDHSLTSNPILSKMISRVGGTIPIGLMPDGELDHQVFCLQLDIQGPVFQ